MTNEQAAAIERLRNAPPHGMYERVYEDMRTVVDAYLAEHPPGVPATAEDVRDASERIAGLLDELESIDPSDVTSDHLHRWWTGLERARARIAELEAENDETDKAHADEIAAHQETLLRIAELEQQVEALRQKNADIEWAHTIALQMSSQEWAALRADAERYRHVRESENHASWHLYDNDQLKTGEELDAAIDAARAKT